RGGPRHQRHGGQRGAHAAAARDERGRRPHGGRAARAAREALPGKARRRLVSQPKAPLRPFLQFKDFFRAEPGHVVAAARAVEDAAQVISRMCDIIMVRTFEQDIIERFARKSRVPVINGLTDEYHPCQILADVYTYIEQRGAIRGRTVAWIGDSNNVCNTWLQAAAIFDFKLHISTPPGYEVEPERMNRNAETFADPMAAARGAHLVTTDVWTSMGF